MAKYQGRHVTKRRRRIPLSVWLAYLLVATLIATGVTFSGYVTEAYGSDSARVAVMATDVTVTLTGDQFIAPGEEVTFGFTVANYENNKVCEVAQKYTIQEIKLLSNPDGTENLKGITFTVMDGEKTVNLPYTDQFAAGENQAKTFTIKANWPAGNYGEEMSFEVDAIEITVNAEQID